MEKEKPMPNTNRHRMIVYAFVINKPEQVHHFQIRLPRTAKQVVAIDYDVFVKGTSIQQAGEIKAPAKDQVNQVVIPIELNPIMIPQLEKTNSVQFTWTGRINPTIGKLKLQSLESANIFYTEWLKLLEWNIGFVINGIFPHQPYTLSQKQKPLHVEVSPQTTMLNGLYEDVILKKSTTLSSYQVNVCVWLEMNEEAKGVEFEFLKPKTND